MKEKKSMCKVAECLPAKEIGMDKGNGLLCTRTAGRRSEGILESLRLPLPCQAQNSNRLDLFQRRP